MVCINLMPWREQRRRRQWRTWRLLAGLVLALLACGVQAGWQQRRLNQQRAEVLNVWPGARQSAAALHGRTLAAQKQLEQQLRARQLREQRQRDTARWFGLVQALGEVLPSDVWLKSLKKEQQNVELQGFSRRVADLHLLRDRLRQQSAVLKAALGALQREASGVVRFRLMLRLGEKEQDDE